MSAAERHLSPLRYPGGKARMGPWLAEVFGSQFGRMALEVWMEPFGGGCGAGLALLDSNTVGEVWLCERNPALAALWRVLLAEPERLARTVEATTVDLAGFYAARETVQDGGGGDDFPLALAALVVNRCSRSGIVAPNVGPIGGKTQAGRWTVGSRFNPAGLAARLRRIAPLTERMRFYGTDGVACIAELDGTVGIEDEMLLFVDPPYLREGNRLYTEGMSPADHQHLADVLNRCAARWLLTYDDEPEVPDRLYRQRRVLRFDIPHTANRQRVAHEYLVLSPDTDLPLNEQVLPRGQAEWLRRDDLSWTAAVDGRITA